MSNISEQKQVFIAPEFHVKGWIFKNGAIKKNIPGIKLYGTKRCHKTQYYKKFLETHTMSYVFLDVKANKKFAEEVRNLYSNQKLNFPTITIREKRLRNPKDRELLKWIEKAI